CAAGRLIASRSGRPAFSFADIGAVACCCAGGCWSAAAGCASAAPDTAKARATAAGRSGFMMILPEGGASLANPVRPTAVYALFCAAFDDCARRVGTPALAAWRPVSRRGFHGNVSPSTEAREMNYETNQRLVETPASAYKTEAFDDATAAVT